MEVKIYFIEETKIFMDTFLENIHFFLIWVLKSKNKINIDFEKSNGNNFMVRAFRENRTTVIRNEY